MKTHKELIEEKVVNSQCNPGDVVTGWVIQSDKVREILQATIDTVLEGERERITSVIQERVDYYTNGTGKAGYQITGEYPKTGDERLEMRLQAYFEVNQALTPLPDKE